MSFTSLSRVLFVGLVFNLSSCVPATQTGTSYSRSEARVLQQVKIGKVLEVAEVVIEGTKSGAGGIVGGAVGAIADSAAIAFKATRMHMSGSAGQDRIERDAREHGLRIRVAIEDFIS